MPNLGTPMQAMTFALDHDDDPVSAMQFLRDWREGDISEWPDYTEWLQEADNRDPVDAPASH